MSTVRFDLLRSLLLRPTVPLCSGNLCTGGLAHFATFAYGLDIAFRGG